MAKGVPAHGLADQGIETGASLHWNLQTPQLVEQALVRGEGVLAKDGPLVVKTGKHTGRSAQDKYIVRDAETEETIWWDNNRSMSPAHFAALKADFLAALAEKETLFVADLFGGSQPEHRVRVRVINELAWHNLFIRTLLVRPDAADLAGFTPEFTIIDLPSFRADPARHGTRGETVIAVNLSEKTILIGISRKSSLARILGDGEAKVGSTAASVGAAVAAFDRGATILRVHDVREHVEALTAARAVAG